MENLNKDMIEYSDKKSLVKYSFYLTYAFLMTTATVTFIEALRIQDIKARHILNLETCISVVAAFFYGVFVDKIKNEENINYKQINITRYTDWAITTPIMLLVLVLAMLYNSGGNLLFSNYLIILALNFFMLFTGYLGEIGKISKMLGLVLGFVGFFGLYGYIYMKFLYKKYNSDNMMIYLSFIILWAIYGLVYNLKEDDRNISYNVLDLFAKCFVGIFFWAYLTKIFVLK